MIFIRQRAKGIRKGTVLYISSTGERACNAIAKEESMCYIIVLPLTLVISLSQEGGVVEGHLW